MQTPANLGGNGEAPSRGIDCAIAESAGTEESQTAARTSRGTSARPARKTSRALREKPDWFRWSQEEDATLLSCVGEKSARDLAALLGRSERAVYARLRRLELSSQLKEGYTPKLLTEDLRVDRTKVRQWILDGKLECQNLHVTRNSIKKLCERREIEIVWNNAAIAVLGRPPERILESMERNERKPGRNRRTVGRTRGISRTYNFRRAGKILQVSEDAVKRLVHAGQLTLSRLRIEETAVRRFIEKYPDEINWQLVAPDFLEWLGLARIDNEHPSRPMPGALKHLVKVRTCPGCLHSFRGNGYWTHIKFCPDVLDLAPEVLQWAADHPRSATPNQVGANCR